MALKPYPQHFQLIKFAVMANGGQRKYNERYKEPSAIDIVAKNARKYRLEKNISMERLADIMGIEYTVIARLERGKTNPSISLIYGVAKALSIEPHLMLMP
jgi:DNA-binding XRE family transcriptional regulator